MKSKQNKGLGKGLSALFGEQKSVENTSNIEVGAQKALIGELAKNKDIILREVKNISLFNEEKIIIVNQVNEKIYSEIESLMNVKENIRIIIIADLLDKRSKLRNLFEKEKNCAIIPCYNDNEITLRNLVQNELKDFKNVNSNTINMIISYSNSNRKTIINNIEKIKSFYEKRILSEDSLEVLLNSDRNEMFENIRDAALDGDKKKLNDLLGNFNFTNEDAYFYLNMINYRLIKLLEIHRQNINNSNYNNAINNMKPPVFWKDKPVFLKLLQKWDKQRVIGALARNKYQPRTTFDETKIDEILDQLRIYYS